MKRWIAGLLAVGILWLAGTSFRMEPDAFAITATTGFRRDAAVFAATLTTLKTDLESLKPGDSLAQRKATESLRRSRLAFKRIEAFMEFFFDYPVNLYNRAPVFEVEEPYMEYQAPIGLQYIESMLLEQDAADHRKELTDQAEVLRATAVDIPATLYGFHATDAAILEAHRLEIVRIITLGITGYDAPVLKSGIEESATALEAMRAELMPLLTELPGAEADRLKQALDAAIDVLRESPGFDRFDRFRFLKEHALPLQTALRDFIKHSGREQNTHPALNHEAANLFSPDAFDLDAFRGNPVQKPEDSLIALGLSLFYETALSGNRSRSCASCHKPGAHFTDGLVKSTALDGRHSVLRNAPTLYYAAFQRSQFYDGRVTSLEDQIYAVLSSPVEMDANPDSVALRLNADPAYRARFRAIWPDSPQVSARMLAIALATFEGSLRPFSSAFDKAIAGGAGMTPAATRGFNLFMGKAQCGTCHFAPLFNGLLPPYYEISELEVIGVPKRAVKGRWQLDSDSGRYRFFPISFNNGAFKTTSARNAAVTAPYMHNGVFRTLEDVVDFYNKGGGRGLGLKVEMQTLSDKQLGLTKPEQQDIVAFLKSLTDS
jgi:cytochrome c peroxidase